MISKPATAKVVNNKNLTNMKKGRTLGWICTTLFIGMMIVALAMLSSCTTTKVVTVPEVHEVIHHQSDTVIQKDSVIHEKETTIMQLDSAAMAEYGIQLKSAERAWLVKTTELEREIERLMAMSATKDSVHDSIPYPVEVIKEVPAKLSTPQKVLMGIGIVAILALIILIAYKLKRFLP